MTIVLLGYSGFIGGKIFNLLSKQESDFVFCDRNLNFSTIRNARIHEKPRDYSLDNLSEEVTVVNMVGNAVGNQQSILDANYGFPMRVLELLSRPKIRIRWLQASSYFQNYKNSFGTDKNYYAKTKQQTLEELQTRTSMQDLKLINLVLPHVTGVNEPEHRLIPQLIRAKVLKKEVFLGSGRPLLPIIGVEDLARVITTIAIDSAFRPKIAIHPLVYMTVREIAQLILNSNFELASFGKLPDRNNEFHTFESIGLLNATGETTDALRIFRDMENKIRLEIGN